MFYGDNGDLAMPNPYPMIMSCLKMSVSETKVICTERVASDLAKRFPKEYLRVLNYVLMAVQRPSAIFRNKERSKVVLFVPTFEEVCAEERTLMVTLVRYGKTLYVAMAEWYDTPIKIPMRCVYVE